MPRRPSIIANMPKNPEERRSGSVVQSVLEGTHGTLHEIAMRGFTSMEERTFSERDTVGVDERPGLSCNDVRVHFSGQAEDTAHTTPVNAG